MKKISIVFLFVLILGITSSPVFALSFKFDFYGGDTSYTQGDFEDPQEIDLTLSGTVMVDIWLVDWPEARPNMKTVQYHFMWHKDSLGVESIASNNPDWQLPAEMLVEDGDYLLGMTIMFGGGVVGPDTLLHTFELRCEAAPSYDWIKATLEPDGFVSDMDNVFYYDVVDGDGIIQQTVSNQCQADFDGDGSVFPSDLMVFLGEYGRTDCLVNPPPCQADFDGDGSVFPSDLMVFLGEYGRTDCLIIP